MSEANDDATLEATPHRRELARQQGHFARSQTLSAALALVGGVTIVLWFGGALATSFGQLTAEQLGSSAWLRIDEPGLAARAEEMLVDVVKALAAPLALILVWTVAVQICQVGLRMYPERLAPDLARVDPLAGMSRVLSSSHWMGGAMGIVYMAALGASAWWIASSEAPAIVSLIDQGAGSIALYLTQRLPWAIVKLIAMLVPIAAIDYGLQWWKRERDLRMTPVELREEARNLQANSAAAARRRGQTVQSGKRKAESGLPVERL